jgi:hypothetical protein
MQKRVLMTFLKFIVTKCFEKIHLPVQFVCCYFLLGPDILPKSLFSDTPSLGSLFRVRPQVPLSYIATGEIMVLKNFCKFVAHNCGN